MSDREEVMGPQILQDLAESRAQIIQSLMESRVLVSHMESESARLKEELADVRAKKHDLLKQRALLIAMATKLGVPQVQIAEILDRSRESVRRSVFQHNVEVTP